VTTNPRCAVPYAVRGVLRVLNVPEAFQPLAAAAKHRQQRSKQGSSEEHRDGDTKRCPGETLVPSAGLLPR
jgi:hypothetical protein